MFCWASLIFRSSLTCLTWACRFGLGLDTGPYESASMTKARNAQRETEKIQRVGLFMNPP